MLQADRRYISPLKTGSEFRALHDYFTPDHKLEDMLNNRYFANLITNGRLRVDDEIYVRDCEGNRATIVVTHCDPVARRCEVSLLEQVKEIPITREDASFDPGLTIKERGKQKWCIVDSNNKLVKSFLESRELAEFALAELVDAKEDKAA